VISDNVREARTPKHFKDVKMSHFIAYHKIAEWGEYPVGGTEFRHYSWHPISKLQKMLGQTIWVVSGEKLNGQMVYRLCSAYQPDHIEGNQEEGYVVAGTGKGFDPHIKLNEHSWFAELLKEQGNFRYGLNEIRSGPVIEGLQQLRFNEIDSFRSPDEILIQKHYEGAKKQITVNAYERNSKAREACVTHHGNSCSVCGFDFGRQYGEIGIGYIHVHHLKPLAEIGAEYEVDPEKDLRPVCPNCHAMLHKKEPPYTVEELRKLVALKFIAQSA
jgi:predicted HNH restriction endonuclease